MKFDLKNKVALVTGGGSGIGKAISQTFAAAGATVHILEMNEEAGKQTVSEITEEGNKAFSHQCNVTNDTQVANVFESIGGIDILVNNAGIAHIGNIENTSGDDMDRLYQVNIKGLFHCMTHAIADFKLRGGGVIINMASIASSVGISDRFAYSMTKGAVLTMTFSVAKDYLKEGIRCNCISPGRVHTPFVDNFIAKNYPGKEKETFAKLSATQPIGRMGKPQEIADLALYLASEKSSFITGSNFPIDGGFVTLNGQ